MQSFLDVSVTLLISVYHFFEEMAINGFSQEAIQKLVVALLSHQVENEKGRKTAADGIKGPAGGRSPPFFSFTLSTKSRNPLYFEGLQALFCKAEEPRRVYQILRGYA